MTTDECRQEQALSVLRSLRYALDSRVDTLSSDYLGYIIETVLDLLADDSKEPV
jgi:hypothetical protein